MAGEITSWPAGMERRYGFTRDQAIGQIAHKLLKTRFPAPLREIEATLRERHTWDGCLLQCHRDGRPIVVTGHWVLENRRSNRRGPTVTEAHSSTVSVGMADVLLTLANDLSQPLTAIGNYVAGARRCLDHGHHDEESVRKAMALAADQVVRGAEQVMRLRNLASDLRGTG